MTHQTNHISIVRQHLLNQMASLRSATTPEGLKEELARSKGLSELAQSLTNTAKVEIDYLVATNQSTAPFLEVLPDASVAHSGTTVVPGERNGITTITRHRLGA